MCTPPTNQSQRKLQQSRTHARTDNHSQRQLQQSDTHAPIITARSPPPPPPLLLMIAGAVINGSETDATAAVHRSAPAGLMATTYTGIHACVKCQYFIPAEIFTGIHFCAASCCCCLYKKFDTNIYIYIYIYR